MERIAVNGISAGTYWTAGSGSAYCNTLIPWTIQFRLSITVECARLSLTPTLFGADE